MHTLRLLRWEIERKQGRSARRLSMTGHLLGGAGSLEAGITVLALRDQIAPPTTNIDDLDEVCQFGLVRDQAISVPMEYAMSNSFGFGGTNAALIFRVHHPDV